MLYAYTAPPPWHVAHALPAPLACQWAAVCICVRALPCGHIRKPWVTAPAPWLWAMHLLALGTNATAVPQSSIHQSPSQPREMARHPWAAPPAASTHREPNAAGPLLVHHTRLRVATHSFSRKCHTPSLSVCLHLAGGTEQDPLVLGDASC